MKLDTIIIFTEQMEMLAEFYKSGFNYNGKLNLSPGHIGFPLDNGIYLGFDQVEEAHQNGGVSLWFAVESIDASFERFVAVGAKVRYEKKQLPMGDTLASLWDLDGNIFGLVER